MVLVPVFDVRVCHGGFVPVSSLWFCLLLSYSGAKEGPGADDVHSRSRCRARFHAVRSMKARQQSVYTAFTAASQMSHTLTNAYAVVAALPASRMIQVDSRGAMAIAYDTDDLRDVGHDLQCLKTVNAARTISAGVMAYPSATWNAAMVPGSRSTVLTAG
ncbi:hypothetical protein [Mesorhizobium caraganae]|uniref:hypothetical protein n=1 Tax=Mesorhizobium caraganae TaxID=483206 RepID=UPI00333776F6